MKKIKRNIVITLAVLSLGISTAFIDSYFEVSKNLDIFINLFKEVNIRYVDPTKPGELMKTAIDGMLKSLDPYTVYIPESKIEDYRFMTTGQYGGIGSLISRRDNYIIVSEPYEGYPAQKAGLLAGDVILEVNGVSAEGKSTE
ncbi:MAG: PDZ domain-containing protein, partial [Bacteroidetes bacterium]